MAILDSLITLLGSIESDKLSVHDERCVVMRNRNAECLRCVRACTSGALAIESGELNVYPEKCIGCGTCAAACPTSAIEIKTPSDAEVTARLKRSIVETQGHPVIACERAVFEAKRNLENSSKMQGWRGALGFKAKDVDMLHEEALCEVPCLGRVDESLIAAMAAYGAHDGTLVAHHCATCNRVTGGTQAFDVMESAENLMGAFGCNFTVNFVEEMPERLVVSGDAAQKLLASCEACKQGEVATDSAHVAGGDTAEEAADPSKRALFAEAKQTAVALTGQAVSERFGISEVPEPEPFKPRYRKVNKNGTLSHFVPTRRTLLYNYLKRLGEPQAKEVTNRVIGHIEIDPDTCTSCRMCAVFCPTGALERAEDGDFWGLVHRPAACVQCRSCQSVCRAGAITVHDTVPMEQFMGREAVLYSMKKPKWEPNKPDSMYNKFHQVIGEDLEMCMF